MSMETNGTMRPLSSVSCPAVTALAGLSLKESLKTVLPSYVATRAQGNISFAKARIWYKGAKPPCKSTTAPRYSRFTQMEIVARRNIAPCAPGIFIKDGNARSPTRVNVPANNEAATYLQTTASTRPTRSPIGLPAYQKAGTVSSQRDVVHATAI